jgi:hypothetical protein
VLERNHAVEAFDYETFIRLLTCLFTNEQISLVKVELQALRDLLMYLNPRCQPALPSRNSLRSYISIAYKQALGVVKKELRSATTKINFSFDLWTSLGGRLSLLGVVAHYLNAKHELRAILLALPRMRGTHIAVNLAG